MARSRISCRGRILSVAVASACACAAFALSPKEAHAASQFDLGIDGDATALMSSNREAANLSTLGSGLKIRFGDRIGLRYGLHLTPEVGYAFDHVFAENGNLANGAPGAENMNRLFAGVRLGFGKWVIPTIYAHVGYGFRSVSTDGTVAGNAASVPGTNGPTFDTGIAVDFKLAKHLMIGPHAEYVFVDAAPAGLSNPQWLAFGGHIDILF
jgi:Outer membrane protein beta-barrel domain